MAGSGAVAGVAAGVAFTVPVMYMSVLPLTSMPELPLAGVYS